MSVIAVPYVSGSVAGLSPRKPGLHPRTVYVGFVVNKVTLVQIFPPCISLLSSQYHSTITDAIEFQQTAGVCRPPNHSHLERLPGVTTLIILLSSPTSCSFPLIKDTKYDRSKLCTGWSSN